MTVPGALIDQGILALLALALVVLTGLALRNRPRTLVALVIGVVCLVPVWIGFGVGSNQGLFIPIVSAACGFAAVVLMVSDRVQSPRRSFAPFDAVVALLLVLGALSLLIGQTDIALSYLVGLVISGVTGYVFGRFAGLRVDRRWIYGAVGIVFTGVAVLAIVEFATEWNPFVLLRAGNSLFTEWGDTETRGGVPRVEGAFGHPIALGASLALAIPLTMGSRLPVVVRVLMVGTMLTATILTFSRGAILAAVLGLVLSLLFQRGALTPAARIGTAVVLAVGAALSIPSVLEVFGRAGDEATNSAAYRTDLVSLLGQVQLVGVSASADRNGAGEVYLDAFRSIDSQFILTGVSTGLLALVAIFVSLAIAVVAVVRGAANAGTIAIVAQLPLLATVALITQYSIVLWFVAGLAAVGSLATETVPARTRATVPPQARRGFVT